MQKKVEVLIGEAAGRSFFDFGKASYGQLEVELTLNGEHLIEVVVGESCSQATILHEHGWRTFIIDRFMAKEGTNTYKFNIPEFQPAYGNQQSYTPTPAECGGEIAPFRYVEVNHYYGEVKVTRTVWYDDFDDDAAVFESSNAALNKVWDFCKYSIKATNVFGYYIDGDRERRPYEGDAYINQLGHFCCDCSYKTARNTISYFEHYPTWPTEWQLLTPVLARDYYLYSGDRASVDSWLKWLDRTLLDEYETSDGLIAPSGKVRDIIDWPVGDRDGYVFGKCNFVPNAYRVGALQAMYELTNKEAYLLKAQKLRSVLRNTMWRNGFPLDSIGADHTALHSAVFALRFGIAEEQEKAALLEFICSKKFACSVYTAQYVLEVCAEGNQSDYVLKMLTGSGERSWLNMLAQGSTITMEGWSEICKPHQDWSHAWGAAPANIIPRWVVGLRPTKPGFKEYELDPHPGDLEYFRYRHKTASGVIEVEWKDKKITSRRMKA